MNKKNTYELNLELSYITINKQLVWIDDRSI